MLKQIHKCDRCQKEQPLEERNKEMRDYQTLGTKVPFIEELEIKYIKDSGEGAAYKMSFCQQCAYKLARDFGIKI
jgi:hypothetical protein